MAAGGLIVAEAGGLVTSLTGGSDYIGAKTIVAANPNIHPLMLAVFKK
jgi:fructose-1,6-bisphosphatase/inositol monophosphatase family enzyme